VQQVYILGAQGGPLELLPVGAEVTMSGGADTCSGGCKLIRKSHQQYARSTVLAINYMY
jgi:hypothetical protein